MGELADQVFNTSMSVKTAIMIFSEDQLKAILSATRKLGAATKGLAGKATARAAIITKATVARSANLSAAAGMKVDLIKAATGYKVGNATATIKAAVSKKSEKAPANTNTCDDEWLC